MGRPSKGLRRTHTVRLPVTVSDWAVIKAKSRGLTLGEFVTGLLIAERDRVATRPGVSR